MGDAGQSRRLPAKQQSPTRVIPASPPAGIIWPDSDDSDVHRVRLPARVYMKFRQAHPRRTALSHMLLQVTRSETIYAGAHMCVAAAMFSLSS